MTNVIRPSDDRKAAIFAAINVYYAATAAGRPSTIDNAFREEVWQLLSRSPYRGIEADAARVVQLLNLRASVQQALADVPRA